jgi:hypothetical protein
MTDIVKRLNYYDHQFLRAPDFTDEQTYHLGMRRRHNSGLHTWGIVQGLDVIPTSGSNTKVTVVAGFAIDSTGREIVLPADTDLDLAAATSGTMLYITIAYDEVPSDPTTEAGGPGNTRITESSKPPSFSTSAPTGTDIGMTLILAKVLRTATGLGPVDKTDRTYAGVKLGSGLTVNALTLRNDNVAQANWPVLNCSGANQASLANAGLELGKALRIEGGTSATDTADYFSFGGYGTFGIDAPGVPNGRFVVQNSGNVGIGTPIPNSALHLALGKALRIEGGTSATDTADYFSFGGYGTFGIDAPGVPNGRFVVQNSGNVGIGTSAPVSKLHIRSDAPARLGPSLTLMNGAGSAGAAAAIDLSGYDPGANAPAFRIQAIDDGAFSAHLSFSAKQPGASVNALAESMRITSAGNVGVGVIASKGKFEVDGMVGNTVAVFGRTLGVSLVASWPVIGFNCYFNGGWKALSPGWSGIIDVDQTDGSMGFLVPPSKANAADNALALSNRLAIHGDGRLVSPMWRATQVMDQSNGTLPLTSAPFSSGGGTLIIIFSGSGFAGGASVIGMSLQIDGTTVGTVRSFTNELNSHKAFTTNILVRSGIAAGNHTIRLVALTGTSTDVNDFFNVTVLEMPF